MTADDREKQIQIALKHVKYKLKRRGDDPRKYNEFPGGYR